MPEKEFIISQATRVVAEDFRNNILKNATEILQRDIQKVTTQKESDNEIYLTVDDHAAVEGDDFQINQSTDSTYHHYRKNFSRRDVRRLSSFSEHFKD